MSRPIHFEIQADDLERAKAFYGSVFGWTFEDYSPSSTPLLRCRHRRGRGAGHQRRPPAAPGGRSGTRAGRQRGGAHHGVEDYDAVEAKILEAGGTVALPKMALTGMAWQGYYLDTEGNTFGIHQPDENAQ